VWNADDGSAGAQVLAGTDTIAFALSADGGTAATAHANRAIRLWVVSSNITAQASWSVPFQITRLHFAPDGKLLGVAGDLENGDSVLELRKSPGGELVASIPNRNTLNAFEFTSDGRRVAIASEDGTARVWDAHSGNPLSPRLVHGYAVQQSCFSPDGTRLATIGDRGFVRLWNAHTGEPLTPLFDFKRDQGGFHGQFSPDGQRFLFTTGAQVAWLLDLRPDQTSLQELQAQAQALASMSLEPDGSLTPLDNATLQRAWETFRSLRQAKP
jgi:WD40 repeat protein